MEEVKKARAAAAAKGLLGELLEQAAAIWDETSFLLQFFSAVFYATLN